jgi:hypothetical protein
MQDKQFLLWLTKAAGVQPVSTNAGAFWDSVTILAKPKKVYAQTALAGAVGQNRLDGARYKNRNT